MRLEPLYRLRFRYPEGWGVGVGAPTSPESQWFFLIEGRVDGRVTGRYRAANHPQRRSDGTFLPDTQGVIVTDDGATIFVDTRGYGRAYPEGRRQVLVCNMHLGDDPRYAWLNDRLTIGEGEVRPLPEGGVELVVDVSDVVWEPIPE
jgi:hypothetical protein